MDAAIRIRLKMKITPTHKELRSFGILIGFLFPLFFGVIFPLISNHNFRIWTLFFGLIFLLLSVLNPKSLKYFYIFWMKLGYYLGWINSRLIFGIIFCFVLFPISLIMKTIGYDPLKIKKINSKSYKEVSKNDIVDLTRIF